MNIVYVIIIVIVAVVALVITLNKTGVIKENFEIVYNQYPNWFMAGRPYNQNDWFSVVYPDMIQAECLPYSVEAKWGSLENMNYNSQAYKFWRI